eukprot:GHVU01130126.1.p1 GENE.GHVU01130126.1~~GHVU01130126.1.p1  ORF type:complete len:1135 (-),score=143.23 GHVU01130126.1:686-4090(-)
MEDDSKKACAFLAAEPADASTAPSSLLGIGDGFVNRLPSENRNEGKCEDSSTQSTTTPNASRGHQEMDEYGGLLWKQGHWNSFLDDSMTHVDSTDNVLSSTSSNLHHLTSGDGITPSNRVCSLDWPIGPVGDTSSLLDSLFLNRAASCGGRLSSESKPSHHGGMMAGGPSFSHSQRSPPFSAEGDAFLVGPPNFPLSPSAVGNGGNRGRGPLPRSMADQQAAAGGRGQAFSSEYDGTVGGPEEDRWSHRDDAMKMTDMFAASRPTDWSSRYGFDQLTCGGISAEVRPMGTESQVVKDRRSQGGGDNERMNLGPLRGGVRGASATGVGGGFDQTRQIWGEEQLPSLSALSGGIPSNGSVFKAASWQHPLRSTPSIFDEWSDWLSFSSQGGSSLRPGRCIPTQQLLLPHQLQLQMQQESQCSVAASAFSFPPHESIAEKLSRGGLESIALENNMPPHVDESSSCPTGMVPAVSLRGAKSGAGGAQGLGSVPVIPTGTVSGLTGSNTAASIWADAGGHQAGASDATVEGRSLLLSNGGGAATRASPSDGQRHFLSLSQQQQKLLAGAAAAAAGNANLGGDFPAGISAGVSGLTPFLTAPHVGRLGEVDRLSLLAQAASRSAGGRSPPPNNAAGSGILHDGSLMNRDNWRQQQPQQPQLRGFAQQQVGGGASGGVSGWRTDEPPTRNNGACGVGSVSDTIGAPGLSRAQQLQLSQNTGFGEYGSSVSAPPSVSVTAHGRGYHPNMSSGSPWGSSGAPYHGESGDPAQRAGEGGAPGGARRQREATGDAAGSASTSAALSPHASSAAARASAAIDSGIDAEWPSVGADGYHQRKSPSGRGDNHSDARRGAPAASGDRPSLGGQPQTDGVASAAKATRRSQHDIAGAAEMQQQASMQAGGVNVQPMQPQDGLQRPGGLSESSVQAGSTPADGSATAAAAAFASPCDDRRAAADATAMASPSASAGATRAGNTEAARAAAQVCTYASVCVGRHRYVVSKPAAVSTSPSSAAAAQGQPRPVKGKKTYTDDKDRMLYVSWIPKKARAYTTHDKRNMELELKKRLREQLKVSGLTKVLLFPPKGVHCKLIFESTESARQLMDKYGGDNGSERTEAWKLDLCRVFDIEMHDKFARTVVKIEWSQK